MKLRMKKNFIQTAWDKAVTYRKLYLEDIEEGSVDSADFWQKLFVERITLLETITTESFCTLHDMATIEAKERIELDKKCATISAELQEAIDEAVA